MKKKMLISLFTLLAVAVKSFSQDMLTKTNRDTLFVKIIEVGDKEIKYKLFNYPDGPTIIANKTEIKSIKFQNGSTYFIDKQKQNFVYFELGGSSFLGINYERQLNATPGLGFRVGLGKGALVEGLLGGETTLTLGLNYLFSSNNHKSFFDVGASFSTVIAVPEDSFFSEEVGFFYLSPSVGFRQHTKNGLMWRISITPLYDFEEIAPFVGISIGKQF